MSSSWSSLDRVVDVKPGRSAQALRNVPNTLSILDSHFPRFPVLPGVLILGSLGQLSALLLEKETGQPWRLVAAEQVRFRRFVQPGDQMHLSVEVTERSTEAAVLKGDVRVDDKVVTQARRLSLAPVPPEMDP